MRSIDQRLDAYKSEHWNKLKEELVLYKAKRSSGRSSIDDVEPSDGNTIIEDIANRAFNKGFDCGTAVLFSVMSRCTLTIPDDDGGG